MSAGGTLSRTTHAHTHPHLLDALAPTCAQVVRPDHAVLMLVGALSNQQNVMVVHEAEAVGISNACKGQVGGASPWHRRWACVALIAALTSQADQGSQVTSDAGWLLQAPAGHQSPSYETIRTHQSAHSK